MCGMDPTKSPGAAAESCCTVKDALPSVIAAVRPPESGATVKVMLPLPVPEAGDVNPIHGAPGATVQLQPGDVAMFTVALPPEAEKTCPAGLKE